MTSSSEKVLPGQEMTLQAVSVKKSRIDTFTVLVLDARAEQLTEKQSFDIGKKHMNLRSKTVPTNQMLTLTFFTIFCSNKIHYDKLCGEENGTLGDPDSPLVEPLESSEQDDADDIDVEKNPLKEIVVKAVLDALRIMHQSGALVRTFEDVLEYGKKLFFLSLNEDVDVEVLTTFWPKSWNDLQLLLKEQGYEDVKEFFVCFCFEEKEITKDGKTSKKTVHHGTYSIMDSKQGKCPYCGNAGYIKYLYLGLKSKVKNWFRNKTMCNKMLAHWIEKDHWLANGEDC